MELSEKACQIQKGSALEQLSKLLIVHGWGPKGFTVGMVKIAHALEGAEVQGNAC